MDSDEEAGWGWEHEDGIYVPPKRSATAPAGTAAHRKSLAGLLQRISGIFQVGSSTLLARKGFADVQLVFNWKHFQGAYPAWLRSHPIPQP